MKFHLFPPVWKTRTGKIRCRGDKCPQKCDCTCPIYLNTQAIKFMLENNEGKAIQLYKQAIKLEPEFSDLYGNLATCYGKQGKYKQALENYLKAHKLNPKKLIYVRGIAMSYRDLGKHRLALLFCDACDKLGKDETNMVEKIREFCQSKLQKGNSTQAKSPTDFYTDCVIEFHKIAKENGCAEHDLIFIPELIQYAHEMPLTFLKNPGIENTIKNDPRFGYFFVMGLSLVSGVMIAYQWHTDFKNLGTFSEEIINESDPGKYYHNNIEPNVGVSFADLQNLTKEIFEKYEQLFAPYMSLEDSRSYILNGMVASFQLGISICLAKFGY